MLLKSKLQDILLFIMDMAVTVFSFCLTYRITRQRLTAPMFLSCLGLLVVIYGFFLLSFRVYRSLWRYAQTKEFFAVNVASCLSGAVFFLVCRLLVKETLPFYFYVLNLLMISTVQVSVRLIYRVYRDFSKMREKQDAVREGTVVLRRAMIVGAGSGAKRLLEEIASNTEATLEPVVLVDDNMSLLGRTLMGVAVAGTTADIPRLIREYRV